MCLRKRATAYAVVTLDRPPSSVSGMDRSLQPRIHHFLWLHCFYNFAVYRAGADAPKYVDGAIAAGVCGLLGGVALVAILIAFCFCHHRQSRDSGGHLLPEDAAGQTSISAPAVSDSVGPQTTECSPHRKQTPFPDHTESYYAHLGLPPSYESLYPENESNRNSAHPV